MNSVNKIPRFGETALFTLANLVTLARLVLAVPVLILMLDQGSTWLTYGGWAVLAFSDRLDGYLARREGTTRSGAFLDPMVDKVMVLGGFIVLAINGSFSWIPVAIVVAREVGVSVYRIIASRRGVSLPSLRLGKWKTAVQFFAVGWVLFPPTANLEWFLLIWLWAAVVLSIISAAEIWRAGWSPAPSGRGQPGDTAPNSATAS